MGIIEVLAVCTSPGGLPKRPQPGRVAIGPAGAAGDRQRNHRVHGGPDQAILVYAEADYARWRACGFAFPTAGAMGENLVVAGLETADLAIGDRLASGSVTLEVTAPRLPCANLAVHHEELPRLVAETGRGGAYCRVVDGGDLGAGDAIRHERLGRITIRAAQALRAEASGAADAGARREAARRLLAEPALAARWRASLERRLAEASAGRR